MIHLLQIFCCVAKLSDLFHRMMKAKSYTIPFYYFEACVHHICRFQYETTTYMLVLWRPGSILGGLGF